jgi:hypothetical protein
MIKSLAAIGAGFALLAALSGRIACAEPAALTPKGQWLANQLDKMGVETKWIAGARVNWDTGRPDDQSETLPGRHTHCSAFVASAAKTLGVYILRPPEHGQMLLANAQNEWLASDGASQGWRPVSGPLEAQSLANTGALVVASYHNHRDNKPGHIAIVRPGDKSQQAILSEGPDVIQAATFNSVSISLRAGFAGHPHAWNDSEIEYYAHAVRAGASRGS